MSKSHYDYSDAQEQQEKLTKGIKEAFSQLGQANGLVGLEDAIGKLAVVPKRWEDKNSDKLIKLFEEYKLPYATVTEHYQNYEAWCLRQEKEENQRKLAENAHFRKRKGQKSIQGEIYL